MNARLLPALHSPLPGVSSSSWARFVTALDVQDIKAVSSSNGLGAFDLRPRRLVELRYATNLRPVRSPTSGRQLYVCDFVAPWTREQFLSDPVAQYGVLAHSIGEYHRALSRGEIPLPDKMSLAGALAILHRGGNGALKAWPVLFPETRVLYDAARSAF